MRRAALLLLVSAIAVVAAVACGSEEPPATLEPDPTLAAPATPEPNPTSAPSPTPSSVETPDPASGPDMQSGAEVGDMAPVFTLPSASGAEVSLESYRGDKNVALVFYRGSFWGICKNQLGELTEAYQDIETLNAEILAISVTDLRDATTVVENWRVSFPVLYDTSTQVTQSYAVYDLLGDGLATPSVFIVDAEGVIRWKYVGRDPGDRPTLSTIKEQLAGLAAVEMIPTPLPEATPDPDIVVGTDVGDTAPGFTLASTAGVDRSLESYRGDKNLVVVFYRAFWWTYCRSQIVELTRNYDKIKDLNAEVLAISVDNLEEASEVVQMLGIPFPILYDPSTEAPQSYMVYNLLGDGLATPSTFVLDKEGVITWKYIARSIGDRPSVSTILAQLSGLEPTVTLTPTDVAPAVSPATTDPPPIADPVPTDTPPVASPVPVDPPAVASPVPTEPPPVATPVPTEPPATATPLPTEIPIPVGTSVGELAPAFMLPSISGSDVSLESYRGDKKMVVVFYRAFWWTYCRAQLGELTRRYDDITALDAEVVAISVDNLSGAEDIARQLGIPFPVLYDLSRMVTQLYEVDNPGDGGRARPATFIVDTEGVITWKYVGSGIGDRPSVSTILAQLAR